MDEFQKTNEYDRLYAAMKDGNALMTKPSTIKYVEKMTGSTKTYIIQTAREEAGDTVFVEQIDRDGTVRLYMPAKVTNAVASQRDSLTTRRRSISGRATAQARKDRGELPGFMKKKKA
jgi:hypothetical protein